MGSQAVLEGEKERREGGGSKVYATLVSGGSSSSADNTFCSSALVLTENVDSGFTMEKSRPHDQLLKKRRYLANEFQHSFAKNRGESVEYPTNEINCETQP